MKVNTETDYKAVQPKNNPLLWLWDVLTLMWEDDKLTNKEYANLTRGMYLGDQQSIGPIDY